MTNTAVSLNYNDKIDMMVVRVVDKESGKVVSELPPESMIKLKESYAELSGLLIDKMI